jgi:hypothetical protein
MEGEQDIAAREIAAALAWLATRERPLQMPGANDHAPRDVASTSAAVAPAPTFQPNPPRARPE